MNRKIIERLASCDFDKKVLSAALNLLQSGENPSRPFITDQDTIMSLWEA